MKDYICRAMCGILGSYVPGKSGPERLAEFSAALQMLERRGPDAEGILTCGDLLIGHKRLSVIDLGEAARQPFQDPSGRFSICYNGELFNYREIRQRLTSKGYSFRTSSDTEVLLYAFIESGSACLPELNGFFAFAVYDSENRSLFLARDRFGVKPLYYTNRSDGFHFASTSKPLRALAGKGDIDRASLALYLQLNYIPEPYSIYSDFRRLPPGHCLEVELAGRESLKQPAQLSKWYELDYPPRTPLFESESYPEACSLLSKTLENAVGRRLISDVPLGSFLSGGIDSSIVSALAAKHLSKLETFSIGFGKDPRYDESPFAEEVSKHIGSKHHTFQLEEPDLLNTLPDFLDAMDEPFADSSALAVYVLSRETRRHVTVALSGDGSDEVFAGYNKHRAEYLIRGISGLTEKALRISSALLSPIKGSRASGIGNRIRQLHRFSDGMKFTAAERYWSWCGWASVEEIQSVLTLHHDPGTQHELELRKKELTESILRDQREFNNVLLNDVHLVLPGDMLTKVDRMSMEHALEVRSPFMDVEVIELAFRMPAPFKIDGSVQKRILRDSFKHLLPESVFTRKKMGFEIPVDNWLRGTIQPMIRDLCNSAAIRSSGIFEIHGIERMVENNFTRTNNGPARAWGLLIALSWLDHNHS
ncbi:MAG: asparagine synthase (glutamine-hydrolyzing) [Bacteroidota bacterium]|jgi:asparagine synthase (glutamine-hydrolysing)